MNPKILYVDDDRNVLEASKRSLGRKHNITTTVSAAQGLELIRNEGPFAVVLSDMRMPEMDGVEFICEVRKQAPDTVCMMLTGNSDQETAMNAVNKGQVFRFLTKPCHQDTMLAAIEAGIRQYRLVTAEKELLQKTLTGSIRVLSNVLELANPKAFAKSSRIKPIVKALVQGLDLEHPWQYEIAAILSQIGCIVLPTETVDKIYSGKSLTDNEKKMYASHPKSGRDLLHHIPRLELCAQMIEHQLDRFDSAPPSAQDEAKDTIALGSQIIHAAIDYESYLSEGLGRAIATTKMWEMKGEYNPVLIDILEQVSIPRIDESLKGTVMELPIKEIKQGMYAYENIVTSAGILRVSKGNELTPTLIERLMNFSKGAGIKEPLKVLVVESAINDDV